MTRSSVTITAGKFRDWNLTDHEEIRRCVEALKVVPAQVFPHLFDREPAVLRILFGVDPVAATY